MATSSRRTDPPLLGLPSRPGWRGELWIGAFFAAAAVALTWPLATSLGAPTGWRGDYFNNIWNAWWVRTALAAGHAPWSTDALFHPLGLSLERHTLSPLNALPMALLRGALGPHGAYNLWLICTFALSGWSFSLLGRWVTGSTAGGVLGGLLYSFNPFHYSYLCQINVASLQYLPLALLFFARTYREGGRTNALLAALFSACLAASCEYYVVYAALTVALMLACGRWMAPEVPWGIGVRRVLVAGLASALLVAVVAAPLLRETLLERGLARGGEDEPLQLRRVNDLLGYAWIGSPEVAIASWPTMLGYTTLLLLAVGWRRWRRQAVWLVVGATFFVLGLGSTLHVAGHDTGLPLPYALLAHVPGLGMLRKPDRFFLLVQLCAALLAAEVWIALRERLATRSARALAFAAVAGLTMVELTAVPLARLEDPTPAYLAELARDPRAETVLDLVPEPEAVANARYLLFQTVHGKRIVLGYCTSLALEPAHEEHMERVAGGFERWVQSGDPALLRWIEETGIDRVVLHRTRPVHREADPRVHERLLWRPFLLLRGPLLRARQLGPLMDAPLPERGHRRMVAGLTRAFGPPLHRDEELVVWAPPRTD